MVPDSKEILRGRRAHDPRWAGDERYWHGFTWTKFVIKEQMIMAVITKGALKALEEPGVHTYIMT